MNESPDAKDRKPVTVEQQIRRRTFLSFTVFAGVNLAAFGAWRWLRKSPKEDAGITARAQKPLRKALDKIELANRELFNTKNLVKTYPKSRAAIIVRKNGYIGIKTSIDIAAWNLQVIKSSGQVLKITLEELRSLPKTELIFDFKCVEGWDQIQHWAGVRFIDFVNHFNLREEATMRYVGMETPAKDYYVGLDIESAMHPQTILAYEMNDKPLIEAHGAPLRLITPVKYGIKNLKRIGTISFSNERTRDYWAEQGYDYYSGL